VALFFSAKQSHDTRQSVTVNMHSRSNFVSFAHWSGSLGVAEASSTVGSV